MEKARKVDKRIAKTINNIKTALVKLLETHKIKDITVVQLTNLASVNRKTFYLHYSEVANVFKNIEEECYNKLRHIIKTSDLKITNLEEFIYTIFKVFIDDEHVLHIMKYTPYSKCFIHMLDKIMVEEVTRNFLNRNIAITNSLQYTIAYHVFGSSRLFYSWLKKDLNLDLKEFSKFLTTLVIAGAKGLFDKISDD